MITAPLHFRWSGEAMQPIGHTAREANTLFVVGERYQMEVIEEHSEAHRRWYFARVRELWNNLPDDLSDRWPSPTHLRKFALIECGFSTERVMVCATKAEARRWAAFIQPMSGFGIVTVKNCVVRIFEPKSQRARGGMLKKEFEASADAVLRYCEDLIGVERNETNNLCRA